MPARVAVGARGGGQAPPAVPDADDDPLTVATRVDRDRPAVDGGLDAMPDRVLDERDQHVRRKRMARRSGRSAEYASRGPMRILRIRRWRDRTRGPASRIARGTAAGPHGGTRSGARAAELACGGSVSVRNWTDASVLNRKWGSTCACISLSSASTACFARRLRSASARCSAAAALASRNLTKNRR